MDRSCFLSFSEKDSAAADTLAALLASAGVRVVRYNPKQLWVDPVKHMSTAIAEEVGCLVSLRLKQPLNKYSELEIQWAQKCGLPVIYADDPKFFPQVVCDVERVQITTKPWAFAHDQWTETVELFRDAAEELADGEQWGEDNEEYKSTIDADLNWAAKNDSKIQSAAIALLFFIWCGLSCAFALAL